MNTLSASLLRARTSYRAVPSKFSSPRIRIAVAKCHQSNKDSPNQKFNNEQLLTIGLACLPALFMVEPALAVQGELGLFEGRTAALIHPAIMGFLFVSTGYAGWLGWQWRRVRTIANDVKQLKSQLPAADAEGNRPASPLDAQIKQLEDDRKALIKGNFRDRHFNWGSLLLGLGVLVGVEGPVNTYIRTGKLFPGPHLYAGAGIVVLWAVAASMVPQMQKGNETARSVHIGLNALNLALFAWQIPTGLEIVGKVFQFTTWP
eukprot:TRINITY_DN33538_c0_g1_i1.p1 TRINITY_DN33538_c0_g1~~TRINITY_DN33538_c0_g1_i1.p1  ORF type:complete len:268 (+),score=28.42 TRINITY_DN33538_c0_g1_i1:23-805(+)